MGLTNIRYGSDMLRHSNSDYFACIPDLGNKMLQFDGTNCTQEELDRHIDLFRLGKDGMWLKPDDNPNRNPGADIKFEAVQIRISDVAVGVPRIRVPRALRGATQSRSPSDKTQQPELAYLLVIQGSSGALLSKPQIKWGLRAVGSELLSAAANGLDVVFAGAILRTNVTKLRNRDVSVVRVTAASPGGLDDAQPSHLVEFEQGKENSIGVIC
jgi:hypothetical protein